MPTSSKDVSFWKEVRALCLDPADGEYDVVRVSDAVARIVDQIGEDQLPDRVAGAVDLGMFTPDEGALLIGVASYSTDDEGSRIQLVLERWLEANADEIRVGMALAHGTVPFRVPSHRVDVLTAVARRFPRFADKCVYFIERYKTV